MDKDYCKRNIVIDRKLEENVKKNFDYNINGFLLSILDDIKNLNFLLELKEDFIKKIEKFIYDPNHAFSIFTENVSMPKTIEKYNIIKYSYNILMKKITNIIGMFKKKEIQSAIEFYFTKILEELDKKDFYRKINYGKKFNPESRIFEQWINIIDFKSHNIIYLSFHLTIAYLSKSDFSIFLRINSEENSQNFLIFTIENLKFSALESKFKDFNSANNNIPMFPSSDYDPGSNSGLNKDFKITLKTKLFEKVNLSDFDKSMNYREYSNFYSFDIDSGVKFIQKIIFENKIFYELIESFNKVDCNKIRGDKTIFKLKSYQNRKLFDNFKYSPNPLMSLEKKLYTEKSNEWYEIVKYEYESKSNLDNFCSENNNLVSLRISKSEKIFNENLINLDRSIITSKQDSDLAKQIFEEENDIGKIQSKKNYLMHSYGVRNIESELEGNTIEKWWKWSNDEFIENKVHKTKTICEENIIFDDFKNINMNLEDRNIVTVKNNSQLLVPNNSILNVHIRSNADINIKTGDNPNCKSNAMKKEKVIYIYSGNKRFTNQANYDYEFEDICVHDKYLDTYNTFKKGYDKKNKWNSNYFEDKKNNTFFSKNFGSDITNEAKWFETWIENPNYKFSKKTGNNKSEKWHEEWEDKYANKKICEKNCTKTCLKKLENVSWLETWKEIYHDDGNISKTCKKLFQENGRVTRENSWGDILIDEKSNKWLKYNYSTDPFDNSRIEYFK